MLHIFCFCLREKIAHKWNSFEISIKNIGILSHYSRQLLWALHKFGTIIILKNFSTVVFEAGRKFFVQNPDNILSIHVFHEIMFFFVITCKISNTLKFISLKFMNLTITSIFQTNVKRLCLTETISLHCIEGKVRLTARLSVIFIVHSFVQCYMLWYKPKDIQLFFINIR